MLGRLGREAGAVRAIAHRAQGWSRSPRATGGGAEACAPGRAPSLRAGAHALARAGGAVHRRPRRRAARTSLQHARRRGSLAFLGLRGLLVQALRDGDRPKALGYAERAFAAAAARRRGVAHSLFDMQARSASGGPRRRRWSRASAQGRLVDRAGRTLTALLQVERSGAAEREGRASDAMAKPGAARADAGAHRRDASA